MCKRRGCGRRSGILTRNAFANTDHMRSDIGTDQVSVDNGSTVEFRQSKPNQENSLE